MIGAVVVIGIVSIPWVAFGLMLLFSDLGGNEPTCELTPEPTSSTLGSGDE
jgi:hypothetical protein